MAETGRCLCGAVSYTVEKRDPDVHGCHCSMCRRWSGGPVMAVTVGSVSFNGEEHIRLFNSSDWAERGFCDQCGTNLFYRLKEPNHYIMMMGTFDDQSAFRLAGEIYVDDKPSGYDFAGDHPRMTGEEFLAAFHQEHE